MINQDQTKLLVRKSVKSKENNDQVDDQAFEN